MLSSVYSARHWLPHNNLIPSFNTATGAPPGHPSCHLRDRGLSISLHALRVAYAAGGDGESDVRVDLLDLAVFVRDPCAVVVPLLLPLSGSACVSLTLPVLAEQMQRRKQDLAARVIQRYWRAYREAKRQQRAVSGGGVRQDMASVIQALQAHTAPLKVVLVFVRVVCMVWFFCYWVLGMRVFLLPPYVAPDILPTSPSRTSHPQAQKPALHMADSLVDDVVMRVSTPHTRRLLQRFNQQAKEVGTSLLGSSRNSAVVTKITANLESLTVRGAFSHLPLLHVLEYMVLWSNSHQAARGRGVRGGESVPDAGGHVDEALAEDVRRMVDQVGKVV